MAVPLAGDETMLIDTSSGTVPLGRLEAAGIPLESVRHVFVSHRHFDHVGGLAPLLTALAALPEASLTVHAAPGDASSAARLPRPDDSRRRRLVGERLGWHELVPGKPTVVGETEITPFLMDHGLECGLPPPADSVAVRRRYAPLPRGSRVREGAGLLLHDTYGPQSASEQAHALGHSTATDAGKLPALPVCRGSSSPTCARKPVRRSGGAGRRGRIRVRRTGEGGGGPRYSRILILGV